MTVYALVMAGGQGTRFWPESSASRPKQYLELVGNGSLLTQSLQRFDQFIAAERRFVVTIKEQAQLAQTHTQGLIARQGLIFEPCARNTAACILLAMASLTRQGAKNGDVVCVVPADHVILNQSGFRATLKTAVEVAQADQKIVTIGIVPTFPHTGYGYIHKGKSEGAAFRAIEFKEKPDFETAKNYLTTGDYLWNAGMFVASIDIFLKEFERCSPAIFKHFSHLQKYLDDGAKLSAIYAKIPRESIDYAVMEKSSRVSVVPANFDWNDLGSWDALEAVMNKEQDNTVAAAKRLLVCQAKGNIVFTPGKVAALIGVDDLVVVSNEQAVLIVPKSRAQEVKNIVAQIN